MSDEPTRVEREDEEDELASEEVVPPGEKREPIIPGERDERFLVKWEGPDDPENPYVRVFRGWDWER